MSAQGNCRETFRELLINRVVIRRKRIEDWNADDHISGSNDCVNTIIIIITVIYYYALKYQKLLGEYYLRLDIIL
jgi:hypothetical protein